MIKNLLNLFFPKVCFGCSRLLSDNEGFLCTQCRHDLPVTNYHFNNDKSVEKIFYGRVKLEQATALLHFEKKGIVQHLLHNLKYKGHEDISLFLGKWLGHELASVEPYKLIDVVIPVPLHRKKLKSRGYNQAKFIAEGLAKSWSKTMDTSHLQRVKERTSQTRKSKLFTHAEIYLAIT